MPFTFTVHPQTDIANVAYELPALPAGVSCSLKQLITTYTQSVGDGPDEAVKEAFAKIAAFETDGLPDVIAKVIYRLHFDRQGLAEDGRLVITQDSKAHAAHIELARLTLDELFRQVPHDWSEAHQVWRDAVLAEEAYDRAFWTPASERDKAGGPEIPDTIEQGIERLQRTRIDAEHVLIEMPAPSLTEFALKCAIALSDPCTGDEMLCAEAQRLLGMEVQIGDYTAVRLAAAAWEA